MLAYLIACVGFKTENDIAANGRVYGLASGEEFARQELSQQGEA
jgi:hypothetical protein